VSESDSEDAGVGDQPPLSPAPAAVDAGVPFCRVRNGILILVFTCLLPAAAVHSFTDAVARVQAAETVVAPDSGVEPPTLPTDATGGGESEWGMARDPSTGGVYYYNKATGSVQWEPPIGWKTTSKLQQKPPQRASTGHNNGGTGAQPAQVQRQVYDNPIDMVQAAIARKRQVRRYFLGL
jgi:WW domain